MVFKLMSLPPGGPVGRSSTEDEDVTGTQRAGASASRRRVRGAHTGGEFHQGAGGAGDAPPGAGGGWGGCGASWLKSFLPVSSMGVYGFPN